MAKNVDENEDIFTDDEVKAEQPEVGAQDPMFEFLKSQAATNDRVAKALEELSKRNEQGPTPQIPITAYKAKTPWNPSGERYKVKLNRSTFMNGGRLREILLSQQEITKLNQLKAGRYRNGKWQVIEGHTTAGDGSAKAAIHIVIPNKTLQQRMENMQTFRTMDELLDMILAEQGSVLAS